MLTKESIITTINSLQEPIEIDDIFEKILFLEKIEKGIKQSENGQVISDEELEERTQTWLV